MDPASVFRQALEAGDIATLQKLHAAVSPHLPQPTDAEAEITMHMARTASEVMPIRKRAWSHRWLEERALPSQLPDRLKPQVDRFYPCTVDGVGISVNFSTPELKPAGDLIRGKMEDAVNDAYANGDREPALVKARMAEARAKEARALFGRLGR